MSSAVSTLYITTLLRQAPDGQTPNGTFECTRLRGALCLILVLSTMNQSRVDRKTTRKKTESIPLRIPEQALANENGTVMATASGRGILWGGILSAMARARQAVAVGQT